MFTIADNPNQDALNKAACYAEFALSDFLHAELPSPKTILRLQEALKRLRFARRNMKLIYHVDSKTSVTAMDKIKIRYNATINWK